VKLITLFAFVAAWAIVFGAQILDGGSPATLFSHPSPLILVFGGSVAVALMGLQGSDVKSTFVAGLRAFVPKSQPDQAQMFSQLVSYAETARRDGLLALEAASKDVSDNFVRRGLELIIDGTDEDLVVEVMESDIASLVERHKVPQAVYTGMGGYAPTLGILGTVMGMIHVLENLDDPSAMGPAIAVAFLATLWGVGSANLIWLPMAAKLKRMTAAEVSFRRMVLDGLLAIQSGATPRLVAERLKSHLSPQELARVEGGPKDAKKNADKA
jgi:chemotaxis protein MotA